MSPDSAPNAVRDPRRLAALRRLQLPDARAAQSFDRLARIAARLLDAPAAVVSLVEEDRQVFNGSFGLPEPFASMVEIPPMYSYCSHVVEGCAALVVEDAREHPMFQDHPALLEYDVVAYLGMPLQTREGHVLGSFAVMDGQRRSWSTDQVALLRDLAASAMTEIELRQELIERRRAEGLLAAEGRILEAVGRGVRLTAVLDMLVREIESQSSRTRCSVLLLDSERRTLHVAAAPNLPGAYNRAIEGVSIGECQGSCGTAALRGEAVIVEDISTDPLWERHRDLALQHGLRACWSHPILSADGEVYGTFAIYTDECRAPDAHERRSVDRAAYIAGVAIEQERSAEALRESEEKFRQIADNVNEVFWIFTPDFSRTIYMSPAYEAVTGQPVSRVYEDARAFLDSVLPEDLPDLVAAMNRVAHEAVVEGVEYRVVRPDGEVRWVLACGFPVLDDRGEVYRVVGTAVDVTERRRSEVARQQSERRLQQILDALPLGVSLADASGHIVWHNPAMQRIWGGVPMVGLDEHAEYRGWWPETGERIRAEDRALARALRGEEVPGEVVDIEAFDGARKSIQLSAVPLRDAMGQITGAIVVQEDVTEARAREARQRLLATALDGLQEGIMLVTPEGEFVYVNETFRRIFERGPARPMPARLQDLAADEEQRRSQESILRIVAEQGRWAGRIWRRRPGAGGAEVAVDVVLGRLDPGRDRSGLVFGIAQDATEQVEREQHLRRVERLASVGTLIGGVAHELNNPLHAIRNFAELMLLDERDPDDQEALEVIKREADRAAQVVSDLRLLARETQEESGRREAVDLNDVVRHVLKIRRYSLETSNVEINEDLVDDLAPVLASRAEIEQVVLNLVVNAEQAMQGQQRERRLTLRTRHTAEGSSVHVVDTGPGIPRRHLERIFDPFFTTKEPGEGTGLGLSLVHSIVTEHGGRIQVDSAPGKGTAFHVELPRAPAAGAPAESNDDAIAPPTRSLRVLVVDDEDAIRRVSVRFLKRMGHRVDTAAEGSEALRLLEDTEYDLILSDLRMPGLSGEDLLQRLQEKGDDLVRRLVFVTGAANAQAIRAMGEADVPVLVKPLRLEDLARALDRAMGADRRPADQAP